MSKQELLRPGALYIRVSTHGRQEELSPAAQKRLLLKYAKDHGIVISKEFIYEEKGISGRKGMEVGDSETNAWKKVSDSFPRSCCILSVNAGGNEIIDTLD